MVQCCTGLRWNEHWCVGLWWNYQWYTGLGWNDLCCTGQGRNNQCCTGLGWNDQQCTWNGMIIAALVREGMWRTWLTSSYQCRDLSLPLSLPVTLVNACCTFTGYHCWTSLWSHRGFDSWLIGHLFLYYFFKWHQIEQVCIGPQNIY